MVFDISWTFPTIPSNIDHGNILSARKKTHPGNKNTLLWIYKNSEIDPNKIFLGRKELEKLQTFSRILGIYEFIVNRFGFASLDMSLSELGGI